MLTALRIRNVVLIDELDIEFKSGFCALTGETGAGKSILLDSLGLALGVRAEARLVRKGTEESSVSAVFELQPDHPAYSFAREADLSIDSSEPIILRRNVSADGRSKAYVNDQPVSAGLLREIGNALVEIHGQFETQGLLNPGTHLGLLDEFMGEPHTLEILWGAFKGAQQELKTLQDSAEKSKEEESYLRESLEDLDGLDPKSGEEEKLSSLREQLMNREQVLEGLNAAYEALAGDSDPVQRALGILDRLGDKLGAKSESVLSALEGASHQIQEALSAIQSLSDDLQHTEHDLESIDERLFALRGLARKHQCSVDELSDMRETLAAQLNAIEHADDLLAEKMQAVEKARKAYEVEAARIHEERMKTAARLDELVQKELPPLKLEKARFETRVEKLPQEQWGSSGFDQVRFLVATNPGAEPGPLNKIASGGEMARFMLALKVVMAEVGEAGTLVFDEVDAGIGGATADAVGERLARLAALRQVLVVTHAPQVAARAAHHMIVRKDGTEEVKTNVAPLRDVQERREEIARMLAGASITEEARAAADKLLETGT